MAAEDVRRDGWVVTYTVEVVFDTDHARTRYVHVGTVGRCTCCGERLDLSRSTEELTRHGRGHERQFTVDHGTDRHTVAIDAAVTGKEVGPRP